MLEVLSPAGNIVALKSAVANRADAVYLGLELFNARLKADNFTCDNIKEWVDFCHLYGVKVYVTINTLIKSKELLLLDKMLVSIEKANVDAIIITDLAVVNRAKKLCPSVALHASTQMGVHNYLGAKFLQELGFTRVVLARECTFEDIKDIRDNTKLEIEYFVHGALCVAFSGQCLLSSIATGNSGNRGLCLQPCRKEYSQDLTNSNGYLISPKDQCLIEYINQLEECGVNSLKIEGRLKSAEYVGLITAKYAKAVLGESIDSLDYSEMKRVFNRGGFSRGYANTAKNQIIFPKAQNHIGESIGEIISCEKFKDNYKIKIKSNFELKNGDGLKIFRENREVGGFEVSIINVTENIYSLFSRVKYESKDSVHITLDSSLVKKYAESVLPKIKVSITANVQEGNIALCAKYKNIDICYEENCEITLAKNVKTTSSEVIAQLNKTGGTAFEFENINVQIVGDLFVPKSVVNSVRRNFITYLEKQIININRENFANDLSKIKKEIASENLSKFSEKYNIISKSNSNIVIADKIDLDSINCKSIIKIVINYNNFEGIILKYAEKYNNLYIKLPKIAMKADLKVIMKTLENIPKNVGIYADNYYSYYLAVISGRPIIGGIGLNLFNSDSVEILGLNCFVVSSELTKQEIENLNIPSSVFAFGYLPVMNFCHCPIQHFTGCSCGDCKYKEYKLSDRYGEYKVRRIKVVNCYFEMLNSSCHYIEKNQLPNKCSACIDVTNFNKQTQIINDYFNNTIDFCDKDIKLTKGHFKTATK